MIGGLLQGVTPPTRVVWLAGAALRVGGVDVPFGRELPESIPIEHLHELRAKGHAVEVPIEVWAALALKRGG